MNERRSIGICFGSSSISVVTTKMLDNHIDITSVIKKEHKGNPRKIISDILKKIDISKYDTAIATGRKFTKMLNIETLSEPEAIEEAIDYLELTGKYDAVASLGGENFIVYFLGPDGRISKVETGNKCASGTGEFFLQQLTRMDIDTKEAIDLSLKSDPYKISGRCSVFCKSDCTHALNIGVEKGRVTSGLCKMMSKKVQELLSKRVISNILVIGGVSQNTSVINFLRESYKNVTVPMEATYFEALGASLIALRKRDSKNTLTYENIFKHESTSFSFHPPLKNYIKDVSFKSIERSKALENDTCIIGLDVGSTTTKAVLIRRDDSSILASSYLRTSGQPVNAAVNCYKELHEQVTVPINIIGLGVTGSGRQIAGLHGLTSGIVNEIIAHAGAAAYFDKEVDTIFEIGGQDAKYTLLTNSVATDYAMNEACSAGTGSFLEEAAKETLDIDFTEIGDFALRSLKPPNFNDQCAAFISSDVKNALQEGMKKEDVIAGLVYSICLNYSNRVKGNRAVGKKVFMQGGVCYNKAVPVAMAALTGTHIIVPPEPGLMGAFGVALVIKERIRTGIMEEKMFTLESLIDRPFKFGKSFICKGGSEKCDRKCSISNIRILDKNYPFGGACNKYYNLRYNIKADAANNNLVALRQDLVFNIYGTSKNKISEQKKKTIGITKSFLTNTFYPLYYHYFNELGFNVVLPDEPSIDGCEKTSAPFCYPVEIAHGLFKNLIEKKPDFIFMPHITEIHNENEGFYKRTCVFVQGEPYYLKTRFKDEKLPKIISPVINFSKGYSSAISDFERLAIILGKKAEKGKTAFRIACSKFDSMFQQFKKEGNVLLEKLKEKDDFAIVLFGRPYNAFAGEANLNIPHKFASRGITIIPHDFLPSEKLPSYYHMYWGLGQQILRSARFVSEHPKLFGVYITNFSCGPDSFMLSYFRKLMGDKPSLTLELDSHSADAGINTRIDAALDIFKSYTKLKAANGFKITPKNKFKTLKMVTEKNKLCVEEWNGKKHPITSPSVEVVIPSMGDLGTSALVAAMLSHGINAKAIATPTMKTLQMGRKSTSCKECLPFILMTGSMVEYLQSRKGGTKTLFFMPKGGGPCRQGQYHVRINDIILNYGFPDAGVLSLSDENSYGGMGVRFILDLWRSIVLSDVYDDIRNALMVLAKDKEEAKKIFDEEWGKALFALANPSKSNLYTQLEHSAHRFSLIPLKARIEDAKIISLIGEVYVRRDKFSQMDLLDRLAEKDFVVRSAPVAEYIYYCNYLAKRGHRGIKLNLPDKFRIYFSDYIQIRIEKKIKKIMSKSRLFHHELIDIEKTIQHSKHLISESLLGEAILTVGLSLREIINNSCGIISIGPFACMPSRFAESILNVEMNIHGKVLSSKDFIMEQYKHFFDLPFLAIETDGNLFPPIIQSKIDIFMLQAERLHKTMESNKQMNLKNEFINKNI
ncbi:MAG: activase [Candidatus Aureabacteria bacterium]|nr:activase [Candidatus Auribacterota bacterium]